MDATRPPKATLQTSSGLLPADVYEVGIEPSAHGFTAWCCYRPGEDRERGGKDSKLIDLDGEPASAEQWLAHVLNGEHGFSQADARLAASLLFLRLRGLVRVGLEGDQPE